MAGKQTAGLRKFDSETAKAAAKRSAEVRRAKRDLARGEVTTLAQKLDTLRDTYQRDDLGPNAAALAQHTMSRVMAGEIPIRHAGEAAELLRVLVDVARLEAGEATAHTAHVSMTAEQVTARVTELQRQAAGEIVASGTSVEPESTVPMSET